MKVIILPGKAELLGKFAWMERGKLLLRYCEEEFERRYGRALRGALRWLARSVRACGGSSAWWAPGWGWAPPYPETSGYLVPTFLRAGTKNEHYLKLALRMIRWLTLLQHQDGWFPAGVASSQKSPSVFNTAQILLGLTEAWRVLKNKRARDSAIKAAHWLLETQEEDGSWRCYGYFEGFFPSYYTRVAWPLALAAVELGLEEAAASAQKCLLKIAERAEGDWVRDMGFLPRSAAFTHTIAYTARGFLECGVLLDKKWWAVGRKMVWRMLRLAEKEGLAGAYDEKWKPVWKGICVTGHAQVALCMLRVCEIEKDWRFLSTALKLIDKVVSIQKRLWFVAGGGLPGSYPIWERYMRFRFPNWAAKFFVDTLIQAKERMLQWVRSLESKKLRF